ncbi:hypothetical protein JNUCC64_14020 [Streptomyces sp. JNUCC 64]
MTRDALLLDGPPATTGAHCHTCGRWTTVPVVIGYSGHSGDSDTATVAHHVCPRHIAGDERLADHLTAP